MNKKIILAFAIVLILVVIVIKSNNRLNGGDETSPNVPITTFSINEIENELRESIHKCNERYKENGSKDFETYFSINFINNNIEKGKVLLESYIDEKDFTWIEIFDMNGEKLKEFPEVDYERNSNIIEAEKNNLISYRSDESSNKYYYLININKKGNLNLDGVCYTIGEIDQSIPMEEHISE